VRTDASHRSADCGHTGGHLRAYGEGVRDVVHVLDDHAVLREGRDGRKMEEMGERREMGEMRERREMRDR